MLDKLMEISGGEGESPELAVLKEIKQLMDSRLGDKLKGVSISKLEVEPKEEGMEGEVPEAELEVSASPEAEDKTALSPQEEEELNKIRSKMV